jgi:hypothetical protein
MRPSKTPGILATTRRGIPPPLNNLRQLTFHRPNIYHLYFRLVKELCWILGDGVDQAADISWFATSIPSGNFTPRTIFGN